MTITPEHWLDPVERQPIPGGAVMAIRRFLVIHFTAGWSAQSSIDGWRERNNGVCAHFIIDRDGKIIQCRPCNRTAGHAGASSWKDPKTGNTYYGLNSCSIGIELANAGDMTRQPDEYPRYLMGNLAGKPIPRLEAKHKNGGPVSKWEVYPQAQIDACEALSKVLVARYNLDDVIGHDDAAPRRKTDPGPAYPMQKLRESCGFQGMPKRS